MSDELATTDQPVELQKNVIQYNPVFPVMISQVLLDLPVDDMVEDTLKLAVDTKNYSGGYTTYFNQQDLESVRGVKELKEAIYGVSCAFGRELKYEANYEKCSIQLWVSVMRRGGYHTQHNHHKSFLSGTFYARVEDDMSSLIFKNPTQLFRGKEPYIRDQDRTAFTSDAMYVTPKVNTLHLWPGWLEHEVPEMLVSGPRVAFSFNVDFLPPGV